MTDQPDPSLARCVCGSPAAVLAANRGEFRRDVACLCCSARTPYFPTRAEAIVAWNRMQDADAWRPIETAPVDESVQVWTGHYQHTAIFNHCRGWCALADDVELVPQPTYWRPLPAPPSGADNG